MEKGDITSLYSPDFIREIKQVIAQARQKVYTAINSAMGEAYRQMDRRTVEQEQQDKDRADYGSQLLSSIPPDLSRNIRCTVVNFNLLALQTFNETDEDIARYSVLHDNDRLFAPKYMLYMPTVEELREEIERQKTFFRLQHDHSQKEEV